MTPEEAIQQLEYHLAMMTFNPMTGEEIPIWLLSKDEQGFCNACETAISALKEIQQYREIGTMEECREAREKQKPKVPEFIHMLGEYTGKFKCPVCEKLFSHDCTDMKVFFCKNCGQAIQWDENLEGMEE